MNVKASKTMLYVFAGVVAGVAMELKLPYQKIEQAAEAEKERADKAGEAPAPWALSTPFFKYVRAEPVPKTDDELIAEAEADLRALKDAAAKKAAEAMKKGDAERAAKKAVAK